MKKHLSAKESVRVMFICTHNSRRSQLGEAWFRILAYHYGIPEIYTYSGGTESTAFNHRMVAAMQRAGFVISQLDKFENPKYLVKVSDEDRSTNVMFSKKFDDSYNPKFDFIAVMVCAQANEACPVVPGASDRISLPYLDPKDFDNTSGESNAYDDKIKEIGRELIYVVKLVKGNAG